MENLYVIDAVGYLFRSYYAIRNLSNIKGESTNALYGFIRSVQRIIKDFDPKYLIAVFDGPDNSKSRKAIYSEYKSNRSQPPEDLYHQIDWAEEFCKLAGIPSLRIPEVEADDVMGSIAKWASKDHMVYLCSSDKDLCQLISPRVKILNTHKNNLLIDAEKVVELYGIKAEQMIDFLAITGDSSDNIPGISGFGPKTAQSLLTQIGTLDALLAHPEKVLTKKKLEVVLAEKEKALMSRKLATINTEVPFPKEWDFFRFQLPQTEKLAHFYTEMGFKSLLSEMDYSPTSPSHKEKETVQYHTINSLEGLKKLVSDLQKQKEIAFDTETTSLNPLQADLVGIGFCYEPKAAYYVPFNGKISKEELKKHLSPLFANTNIAWIAHNAKYDLHILVHHQFPLPRLGFDTLIASYLLNPDSRQHSLDELVEIHFNKKKIALSDLLGPKKDATKLPSIPIEKVSEYCSEDVDYTFRLKQILASQISEKNHDKLLYELELPLVQILREMEENGMFIDKAYLSQLATELEKALKSLEEEIYELANRTFNIKSPKQLSEVLFQDLQISPPKKTKTGFSTNAEVLDAIQDQHPVIAKILNYRLLEKLRSTYVYALPEQINPDTNRIHCSFNQTIAATGRLSCQNPNLQNIPIRSEEGRKIRQAFRAEKPNWSYLSADYSQIELRILAHFSEDPNLVEAFEKGEDIHASTAAKMLNIPIEDVTPEKRYQAKAVNFGIIYGQQAFGLSKQLRIPVNEAHTFIETYFKRFGHIKDYLKQSIQQAQEKEAAHTFLGRSRPIPDINSQNKLKRSQAERLAINTPLQGTAADIIKMAMLKVDHALKEKKLQSYMILQVHDELIFECPDSELNTVKKIVKTEMENVYSFRVPLIVDIKIGKNWKEC